MADDNVGLVRRAYEAFGRGDIPAVMEAFTHDIEWNVPAVLPHGTRARGPEEVGQVFQGIATTWEGFGVELDDLVGAGDRVFAIGRAHGRLEGRETGYGFVHCWTVRDGALARLDEYVDPDPEVYGG
jgi:ketosteroid isomerase-like protein